MRLIEHFFRILAPSECLLCGTEDALLCPTCCNEGLKSLPERCYRCNTASTGNKTCSACRQESVVKHAWVRTEYTPAAKQLVYALKFNFARDAARQLAREISTVLPVLSSDTLIVHVPAATSHVRQRGFDQSALIARELAHATGLVHVHALARSGQQRQVGSDRQTRRKQMKSAFRVVSEATIHGAPILLVDDVLTTGSTLEAAGLALRRAGAQTVSVATFARAL